MKNKQRSSRPNSSPTLGGGHVRNVAHVVATSRRVDVTEIRSYERNPRHGKNPQYDRIKDSILCSGMDQPLLITRRPAADCYIVQAGGNTRLRILQELYESTGDERFRWVDCRYVEWDRESSVLLAHLRENELRGDLTFIDKAQAILDIKTLVAEEIGVGDISHRQLETVLKDHGYRVSHALISIMSYAAIVLAPLMPAALHGGLGKPQVQRVRRLDRVARDIWTRRHVGAEAEFNDVFAALCRRYDAVDWQFGQLRQALETEIAEAADVSIQVIRMELGERLSGREPVFPLEQQAILTNGEEVEKSPSAELAEVPTSSDGCSTKVKSLKQKVDSTGDVSPSNSTVQIAVEVPARSNPAEALPQLDADAGTTVSLEALRNRSYALACRLAERHGLAGLIAPLPDNGMGFVVRECPALSMINQLDDEMLALVTTMWWQLAAFSDVALAPPEIVATAMESDSMIRVALQRDGGKSLVDEVWTVDPAWLGRRFWGRMHHEDWHDWVSLAQNYRQLNAVARLTNTPLWSVSP